MIDDAPELGTVSFHLDEGAAKLTGFSPLRKSFLQQAAQPILLPLNPEDVLNLLTSTRARNLGVREDASHHFVAREAARVCELLKVCRMRISQAHRDSMLEIPHPTSIGIAIALSRRNRCCARE